MPTVAALHYPDGSPVALDRKLGEGGEGAVYAVSGRKDIVAKVYAKPPSLQQIAKLRAMIDLSDARVREFSTWPMALALDGGAVAGFTMPRLGDYHPIHELFGPKRRLALFPEANWQYLVRAARNLASAFEVMHAHGVVVGDVNSNNIAVEKGAIMRLMDTDSFQIRSNGSLYHCLVGVPEYQPPEMINTNLAAATRTPENDNFSLAVVIFQLLFVGKHPFVGVLPANATGGATPGDNIAAGRYFYGKTASSKGLRPPPGAANLGIITPTLASMFEYAFTGTPQQRPTAAQWRAELKNLEGAITTCKANLAHRYLSGTSCVWCALEATSGMHSFVLPLSVGADGAATDAIWTAFSDVEARQLWSAISAVPPPAPASELVQPTMPSPSPSPLPDDVTQHARRMAWISLSVMTLGVASSYWTNIFGWLFSGLVFWIYMSRLRPEIGDELRRRANALQSAESNYRVALDRYRAVAKPTRFGEALGNLEKTYRMVLEQPTAMEQHRMMLERRREADERRKYLDGFALRDATIPRFGPKRKDLLLSFGIETALDIGTNVLSVPGIGEGLYNDLLAWRRTVERGFRFDPRKGLDPKVERDLKDRFAQARAKARAELNNGVNMLTRIREEIERQRPIYLAEAVRAADAVAQAKCDINAVAGWLYRK